MQWRQFKLMNELRDIVGVINHVVGAAGDPLTVTMSAQVGCDHVVMLTEFTRHPVPVAAMITTTMHQQQRRCLGIPPIHVVQTQPLGVIEF